MAKKENNKKEPVVEEVQDTKPFEDKAKTIFELYPGAQVLYFSTDGEVFFKKNPAVCNQIKIAPEKQVITIKR